jgi:hypothetical protein
MPFDVSSALFPRKHARHAKPAAAPKVLLAGGMTAAFAVTDVALMAGSASAGGSTAQFERLAQCESGGNWSINTGNGYYGGLQFNLGTWRGVGMSGYPHQASKATQIAAGQKLHSQRGWGPWPACSRKLGLSGDGGYSGSGAATTTSTQTAPKSSIERRAASARASRARAANQAAVRAAREAAAKARAQRIAAIKALKTTTPPRFDGHVLTVEDRAPTASPSSTGSAGWPPAAGRSTPTGTSARRAPASRRRSPATRRSPPAPAPSTSSCGTSPGAPRSRSEQAGWGT